MFQHSSHALRSFEIFAPPFAPSLRDFGSARNAVRTVAAALQRVAFIARA
jgi:hypothetical protein